MTDKELVELMFRYAQLKDEYENFLNSELCKQVVNNGNNTPDMLTWVTTYRGSDDK